VPTIVIRLDPAALADPDADLRYRVPDLLAARTGNLLRDDGYGYEAGTDAMLIFLRTPELPASIEAVTRFLMDSAELLGQDLRPGAQAGTAEVDPVDARACVLFYPPEQAGVTLGLPE
jgi:hypothetical protein